MIIEFVGLPGAGKTTLARRTAEELGVEYVNVSAAREKCWYPIRFALGSPVFFIWLLCMTIREAGLSARRARHMLFVMLSMAVRDEKARACGRERMVVLDEGLTQYALSLYRHPVEAGELRAYMARVRGAREIRHVEAPRDVRRARMEKRGRVSRAGIEHNDEVLRAILEEGRKRLCYILPQYDEGTDTHFYYLYDFIRRISRELDLELIVEKANARPRFEHAARITVTKSRFALVRFLRDILALRRARRAGCRTSYVHYSFTGALAGILCGMRVFYWNCGMPWLYKRGWLEERVFRLIMRRTILVTGCDGLAREYNERYRRALPYRVMPNWIDLERFNVPHKRREKKTVLFVHHLSRRKGADMIVPTAALMPDVEFVVVGSGPEEKNIRAPNVRLVGKVSNKDMPNYFAHADVFFMPSEEEGFPHVLLEAMASGVPYVASDVGCVRSVTPPEMQSYLVTDRTPENFSQRIRELLKNSVSPAILLEYVKRFELDKIADRFPSLFTTP